jgi:flagellar biosynthetic protein FliR
MTGLQLSVGESVLAAFLLAVARTAGFVMITPPFNSRGVPVQARVGVAIALALPITGFMQATAPSLTSTALLFQMIIQIVIGLTIGFFVLIAVATIQAVGDLLDVVGGFSLSMALDPLLLVQTSVMGRLHQITAATMLFVTDGHLMIIHGLARSVQAMPVPSLSMEELARVVTRDFAGLFAGAVQITAPIIAAMLVADASLGLLTRAAPALNAFSLAYPLKILFTLLLAGLVIARLPEALEQLVERAVLTGLELSGASRSGGG